MAQDKAKANRHFEKAAMRGHVPARHNLGCLEIEKGNVGRAVRHFSISAKMGYDDSIDSMKKMFAAGQASKQQFSEALKGYQVAIEEMRSPERDEAKPFINLLS